MNWDQSLWLNSDQAKLEELRALPASARQRISELEALLLASALQRSELEAKLQSALEETSAIRKLRDQAAIDAVNSSEALKAQAIAFSKANSKAQEDCDRLARLDCEIATLRSRCNKYRLDLEDARRALQQERLIPSARPSSLKPSTFFFACAVASLLTFLLSTQGLFHGLPILVFACALSFACACVDS